MTFFRKQNSIIIGIHGLCNKPERRLLAGWWELALREGLGRRHRIPFKMVYWAHHIYPQPLDPDEKDPESPRFLSEPYTPANPSLKKRGRRWLRKKTLQVLERVFDWALISRRDPLKCFTFEELLLKRRFPDLGMYYSDAPGLVQKETPARQAIQQELYKILAAHRDDRVMLIAHSMGSIIAYDVLSAARDLSVDLFLTIGSPLGIPTVLKRAACPPVMTADQMHGKTPDAVKEGWFNYSDLEDRVALNYTLGDDFLPNSSGIRPVDKEVFNNYSSPAGENHHKSYGYLRCPELAAEVSRFLSESKKSKWKTGLWAGVLRFFRKLGGRP